MISFLVYSLIINLDILKAKKNVAIPKLFTDYKLHYEKIFMVKKNMLYSDRLKQLCIRKGINHTTLANYLGISKSRFSNYINEKELMPLKYLNNLSSYLDCSLDYLLEFTDKVNYKGNKKELDKIEIGKRLKDFRKENKLTQIKLADTLHTVHPVITNYEKGKYLIATPFLYEICKKYHISADYLLGKTKEPKYLNK